MSKLSYNRPQVRLENVSIDGESYFRISNVDNMRPFFMSIVSDSDHWLFIASNGGISAGRKNAQYALFPYYTDDKITESSEITGSKSIFRIQKDGVIHVWEPFSIRGEGRFSVSRNLYKHSFGNKVIFEETNHDLQLNFRYEWQSSDTFGFIRKASLTNLSSDPVAVSILDGLQNLLPAGVNSDLQNNAGNLVDAYKRSELDTGSGLGIFALSANIVDKAEPSEALLANVVWSVGLDNPVYLLSSLQLPAFRRGMPLHLETDVKAEKGAYFIHQDIVLQPQADQTWRILANVSQTHTAIVHLIQLIKNEKNVTEQLDEDVRKGTSRLMGLVASADGLQVTSDPLRNALHFANTMFNIMRGGIFDHHYQIEKWDFRRYLRSANRAVFEQFEPVIEALPEVFDLAALKEVIQHNENPHLTRLCLEYLPLKFSRRHGDPSRPWNKFSINTRNEKDGSKVLDYEGNWRDIFQNWEALAHAYPEFSEGMMHKFLNATTFDGYNPYRVTKDGFDWETIEPDNPWSYIGYWGDHQIIYLLKFLEFQEQLDPGKLAGYFDREIFVYANVPYKIKPYAAILQDPKDTIVFDHALDRNIRQEREALGADAALLRDQNRQIYTVNFLEKILATVLAKLSNLIPEAGIWMNTQRPEWNDANNALVGNGVSVVTLCYLRRFLHFMDQLVAGTTGPSFLLSEELAGYFEKITQTLSQFQPLLQGEIDDRNRKTITDALGQASGDYRTRIYEQGFTGKKQAISFNGLRQFVRLSLAFVDHSIRANKRADNLYHAYNLVTVRGDEMIISRLSEMLEGQVAALSSGLLSAQEALDVLDTMRKSALYREDQSSYLLYPNKQLPGFLEKNTIPAKVLAQSALLLRLLEDGHKGIVQKDVNGEVHFNGHFRNAADVNKALQELSGSPYAPMAEEETATVLQIFESVFNHKAFTGRSGTFYGYEGLGSIYWHMVSKLLLAVQECCLVAGAEHFGALAEHYYQIQEGIGVHKPPTQYGAFPTDPYSHTPAGKGAQQPGMTGQVKEDLLCRIGELGVWVQNGCLGFSPRLLQQQEFLTGKGLFNYVDVQGRQQQIALDPGTLAFTCCQVPVLYRLGAESSMDMFFSDGTNIRLADAWLDKSTSRKIFARTGAVSRIEVQLPADVLQ